MVTDKPRKDRPSRVRGASVPANPWTAAPEAPVPGKSAGDAVPEATAAPVAESPQRDSAGITRDRSPLDDVFEVAPWAADAGKPLPPPSSARNGRSGRRPSRARPTGAGDAGYVNPWNEPAAPQPEAPIPAPRKKPAKKAAVKKAPPPKAALEEEPVAAPPPEQEAVIREIPVETVTDGVIDSLAKSKEKARDVPVEDLTEGLINIVTKPDGTPREVQVENLASGIVSTLGDGMTIIVNTGFSAGSALTSGIYHGATAALSRTRNGIWVVCRFVSELPKKETDVNGPG